MSHTTSSANNNPKSKNGSAKAPVAVGTPVPAKLEELEARLAEYNSALSKAKKAQNKASESLAKASELANNQLYCVAVSRQLIGKADENDLAIIASHKAAANTESGLAKFFAKEFKDADEVVKAWESLAPEMGTVSSAIAETKRLWNKGFNALYKSIGVTSQKSLTPDLLKGLCPFMQVATADGLKAAMPSRKAVRKNGKAVKVKGNRVYKYTLRAITAWNAKSLFKTLEMNFRMQSNGIFTEDELKVRIEILNAEHKALAALKAAKNAKKSEVAEQAAEAAKSEDALKAAAKAAGRKSKENVATLGSKEVKVA